MGGTGSTRRGQGRRTAILRAALEVVGAHGVHATTHRKVARAAGVPTATTTYYFATLDDLLEETLRRFVAEEIAALRRATEGLEEGPGSLEDLAGRVARVVAGGGLTSLAQFELYLEAARRPALRAVAADCLAAYEAFARTALELLGSPRAAELAPVFVATADGLGLRRAAGGAGPDVERLRHAFVLLFGLAHEPAEVAAP